jgi:hypothetical protein
MMAALGLTLAACSKDDDALTQQPAEQQPTEQPTGRGIPFTATISIGEGGTTRALADGGTTLTATWEEGEKVALIHNGVSDEMTVASVSGGKATITGKITGSPTDGDAVTIIYPATAAKGTTGEVKGNLLKTQKGTLAAVSEKYDVRKGSGTLTVTGESASLKDDVAMANQYAVWKLTLTANARNLCILADNEAIAGATLEGEQGTEFTVAVPVVTSKTITVVASDDDNNCYYYKNPKTISLTAGKYYRSEPAMTPLGTDEDAEGGVYKITGTYSGFLNTVTIPAGKTAVLSGATISGSSHINCESNVTIILMGSNSITVSDNNPAIIPGGSGMLTITGTGSLTATGGPFNPGIGPHCGNSEGGTCGDILICSGTIDVTGGNYKSSNYSGAGIGTGNKGTCGNITITTGVTSVTARKGSGKGNYIARNSIGYGAPLSTCGTVTIGGSPGYINDDTYTYEP